MNGGGHREIEEEKKAKKSEIWNVLGQKWVFKARKTMTKLEKVKGQGERNVDEWKIEGRKGRSEREEKKKGTKGK